MPNAPVVTGLISESTSTKNGFIYQSGRKYKKGCRRTSIQIPNEPRPGAPRHFFCTKFRANVRRTDCVGPIYSHIWRPKSNLDWSLVITLRSRDICTLTAQKSEWTRHFWEIRPWYCAHVLSVPLPALNLFFLFPFRWTWDPLRPKYIKIYKNQHVDYGAILFFF